ncbi:MAG: hypothetical protein LBV41_13095 [Cytophagaceae bacterium]|jgi:hypothetical protein|nr:hypothetical protein [Cytophagaceae bacterium]
MNKPKSYDAMLAEMSNALNGALNSSDILGRLERYGITADIIRTTGLEPLENVKHLFAVQKREQGEQIGANVSSTQAINEARSNYMVHLQVARIAFKEHPGALLSVSATGSRKRSISGFLKEAREFYTNILEQPRLLGLIARFNITDDNLKVGLTSLTIAEKAHQAYLKEKGEAQEATIARDEAFDSLYSTYSDFRAIARIALADTPQLLEQMGIVAKR